MGTEDKNSKNHNNLRIDDRRNVVSALNNQSHHDFVHFKEMLYCKYMHKKVIVKNKRLFYKFFKTVFLITWMLLFLCLV